MIQRVEYVRSVCGGNEENLDIHANSSSKKVQLVQVVKVTISNKRLIVSYPNNSP